LLERSSKRILQPTSRPHATRLRATNLRLDAQPGFETHLRNLRGLAGTGLARDDDDLIFANGGDDFILACRDGKIWRILNARDASLPLLPQLRRGSGLGKQPIEHRIVRRRMMLIAL